jgi:hypothetical protein
MHIMIEALASRSGRSCLGLHSTVAIFGVLPTTPPASPKPSNSSNSKSTRMRYAVSLQSMILEMVRILKNKPFQRARRVGIIECLLFGKVLKILLIHVPGECERLLKAPSSNIRGETNISKAEQTLGSRTPHRIDIRLDIEEIGLNF